MTLFACDGKVTDECGGHACTEGAAPSSNGGDETGADYVLPEAPPSAVPIEGDLVAGLTSPGPLAVDAANVYYAESQRIMACRKSGCDGIATELAPVTYGVGGIVSDGREIFWTVSGDGTVMACGAAGCGGKPRKVASAPGARAITIANDMLYWTGLDGLVQRCAKRCTTPETLVTDSGRGVAAGVVVVGTNVYWTLEGNYAGGPINGAVRSCSTEGACVPRTLADRQNIARGIVVRNGTLAWTADGDSAVRRCSLPACTDTTTLPLAGQLGIAIDDEKIYWSFGSGGWIQSASHDGTEMQEFVTGQKPTHLATDDTNLYWISTDIADSRGGVAGTGRIVSRRRTTDRP